MLPLQLAYDTRKHDPNDILVQQFIDRGDWRGALRFIERIHKKNPSVRLEINMCLIGLVSGNVEKTVDAAAKLGNLINNGHPIVDMEILEAIDNSLPDFVIQRHPSFVSNLWKRASDTSPKSLQIKEGWFQSCCRRKNFVQASIVSLQTAKISKTKHSQHWRSIAYRYLDAKYGNEQSRDLSGNMSFALCGQALKAIPTKDTKLSTVVNTKGGKNIIDVTSLAVQSATDLRLILKVYEVQNKAEEALALLDDTVNTGLRSKIGGGNWELVLEKIRFLTMLKKFAELWRFCYQLLCDAASIDSSQSETRPYSFGKTADDMAVWRAAVLSCHELAESTVMSKLTDLTFHPGLQKRHRLLASIDLSIKCEARTSFIACPFTLETVFQSYLEHFAGSGIAYADLRPFAALLSESGRELLLRHWNEVEKPTVSVEDETSLRSWMFTELNKLKFEYTLRISHPQNTTNLSLMDNFTKNCLELYSISLKFEKELAITERRTGDEAAVLAACTLLHMYKSGDSEAQLQATLVLEKLLEHSRHHYGAIVLLIRLYVRQGVFHKAYEYYQRLDLKNIQTYTESWILLNRVASIFPYRKGGVNHEVHELLKKHAKYAQDKQNSSQRLINLYQEKENYVGLCDVYEFLDLCERSISKISVLAELSRFEYRNQIGSFNDEPSPLDTIIGIQSMEISGSICPDLRSVKAFPNYEHFEAGTIESLINLGPLNNHRWVECEQQMFRWRRWLSKGQHVPMVLEEHSYMSEMFFNTCEDLKRAYQMNVNLLGMTEAELLVGWGLNGMSAFNQAGHAVRAANPEGKIRDPVTLDIWVFQYIKNYDLCWKRCMLDMPKVFKDIEQISEDFKNNPVVEFDASQWETLHEYFKTTELLMIYPTFVADAIMDAEKFRDWAKGSRIDLSSFESLNREKLSQHLKTYLMAADIIINNYCQGARIVSAHWQEGENLTKLVKGVRATNCPGKYQFPLRRLLEEDWVREKCLDVVQGWRDALRSIEMEDPQYWWNKHWYAQAVYM